jgi:hypothetical protein
MIGGKVLQWLGSPCPLEHHFMYWIVEQLDALFVLNHTYVLLYMLCTLLK